ncbi:secondary thiamine-phosphate synthase enzyme YjbQ [Natronogracilivirga saccharolytica]|uniref:YjbQ family protein n=1 Tax=Natronogracilivirga saccharolytica TaxID=2812953 RepID=A0A8J7RP19_9BACT|nr:YjbQ family protein [Natronogracilivirga saccharolytica]
MWHQQQITLRPRSRGFHLVTDEIVSQLDKLSDMRIGLAHIHIMHTSASLTINENADPTVREDFEMHFTRTVPEDTSMYKHTLEGPDDMTSHIKASILGPSLTIPVSNGRLSMGTWQGIYLCEHRNRGGARALTVTLHGTS